MKQKLLKWLGSPSKNLPPPSIGVAGASGPMEPDLIDALSHLQQLGRIDLAGWWDPRQARRRESSGSLPIPPEAVFSDLEEFLAAKISPSEKTFDAIFVTGEFEQRSECIQRALSLKFHVLTDPPLAANAAEGAALIECASAAGVHLGVLHKERYRGVYAEPLGVVRAGLLGEILFVRLERPREQDEPYLADRNNPLTTLYGDLYLVRACASSPVTSIHARAEERRNRDGRVAYHLVQLHHAGGGNSTIQRLEAVRPPDEGIEVHGTKGSLRIHRPDNVWLHWEGEAERSGTEGTRKEPGPEILRGGQTLEALSSDSNARPFARALDDAFASFQRDLPPPVDGREAWHNLKALDAAQESVRTGEVVRVEIPFPR